MVNLLRKEQFINWTHGIQKVLCDCGRESAWLAQIVVAKSSFMKNVREELAMQAVLEQFGETCRSTKGVLYR